MALLESSSPEDGGSKAARPKTETHTPEGGEVRRLREPITAVATAEVELRLVQDVKRARRSGGSRWNRCREAANRRRVIV